MERQQFSAGQTDEAVLQRLRLLEGVFDPVTRRHLEAVGVAEGWTCLEIGAGAGSVAQWLAARAGPAGKVVATDIETRFLDGLASTGLEVRRHNILDDALETNGYDLVHCRTVLMWLPEPGRALSRMADAVRPGGWLVVEESDYGSVLSADVADPAATPFTATSRRVLDFMHRSGIGDPYFGRRVRGLVEGLGLVDIAQDGWTCVVRGGEPMALFDAAAVQMGAAPMMATGLLAKEELESVLRLSQNPAFAYPGLTMFSAWGRKPA
jgi:SAM-dependent methyltransferase